MAASALPRVVRPVATTQPCPDWRGATSTSRTRQLPGVARHCRGGLLTSGARPVASAALPENDNVRPVHVLVGGTFKNPFSSRDSEKNPSSSLMASSRHVWCTLFYRCDGPPCPPSLLTPSLTASLHHDPSDHRHRQLLDHDQVDVGALAYGPQETGCQDSEDRGRAHLHSSATSLPQRTAPGERVRQPLRTLDACRGLQRRCRNAEDSCRLPGHPSKGTWTAGPATGVTTEGHGVLNWLTLEHGCRIVIQETYSFSASFLHVTPVDVTEPPNMGLA
ncbi:hypothetical protein VTK56DRAFT_3273 [Thermocarpiscus australiensis]